MSILLLGTHGQFNQGDELLLETFLHNLSDINHKIYVNSYTPRETASDFGNFNIQTFHTRKDKLSLLAYLLQSRALIFAGGSVIKELNAAYGGQPYATLKIIDTITRAAKALGKPIIFANIGIGPLETDEGQRLGRQILERANLVGVRDIESVRYAQALGLKEKVLHVPDAAFSLDRSYFIDEAPTRVSQESVRQIAINVTRNISQPSNWGYFFGELAESIIKLAAMYPDAKLVGVAMQEHESANDYELLSELNAKLQDAGVHIQIPRLRTITEVAQIINESDLLIAEKLHAIILSAILHKPFVGLEYDVKVKGVCKDLGMDKYSVDICSKFPHDAIFKAAVDVLKKRQSIKEELAIVTRASQKTALDFFALLRSQVRKDDK